MLLITGPGRSGTSVLALFCRTLGYDPGGAWYDAVDAGLEFPRVVKINDMLVRELRETGGTSGTLTACGEEMRALSMPVIKDPRFTYHPDILRAWYSVRTDLSVLLTYRKPEHCMASRQRNARNLMVRGRSNPDVIRRDLADTLETLLELDIPYELLLFPMFLNRYDRVWEAFHKLGLNFDHDEGETVWKQVVDQDKVHFGSPDPSQTSSTTRRRSGWNPFGR